MFAVCLFPEIEALPDKVGEVISQGDIAKGFCDIEFCMMGISRVSRVT